MEALIGLQHQRLEAVLAVLHDRGVSRVLDLGCGNGTLVRMLLRDSRVTEVVGMDVARRHLDRAAERWRIDEWPPQQRQRLKLIQGSLLYRDTRLNGFDAAVLVEVIEHLEPTRLETFARVLFGYTRPGVVIMTTPNREYNVQWPRLGASGLRHRDHRFEWTRAEFQQWAARVAAQYAYTVDFRGVGPEDPHVGSPTQMGQALYSHKQLHQKNTSEMQEMLWQKGINWHDYPARFKRGGYFQRRVIERPFTAEELAQLPPLHEAHKHPGMMIRRQVVVPLELPPLLKLGNRLEVVFHGCAPEPSAEPAPAT